MSVDFLQAVGHSDGCFSLNGIAILYLDVEIDSSDIVDEITYVKRESRSKRCFFYWDTTQASNLSQMYPFLS